ncbi:hypothetical protein AAC387_Pa02g1867 [Persea americana]
MPEHTQPALFHVTQHSRSPSTSASLQLPPNDATTDGSIFPHLCNISSSNPHSSYSIAASSSSAPYSPGSPFSSLLCLLWKGFLHYPSFHTSTMSGGKHR